MRPAPPARPPASPAAGSRTNEMATPIGDAVPSYPSMLQSQGVEGRVVAMFVVDSTGQVDVPTFKVVRSDHELFTAAVRNVLPRLRYSPARVDGRAVRQLIEREFTFGLGR